MQIRWDGTWRSIFSAPSLPNRRDITRKNKQKKNYRRRKQKAKKSKYHGKRKNTTLKKKKSNKKACKRRKGKIQKKVTSFTVNYDDHYHYNNSNRGHYGQHIFLQTKHLDSLCFGPMVYRYDGAVFQT